MRESNYPRGRVLTTPPPEFETERFVLDTDLLADISSKQTVATSWIYWVVVPIYLWAVIELLERRILGASWSFVPLVVMLVFNVLIAFSQKRWFTTRYRKLLSDPVEGLFLSSHRTDAFSSSGVTSRVGALSEGHYSWSIVKRIRFESSYVSIGLAANQVVLIPNYAFSDQAKLQILRNFADENNLSNKGKR